MSPKPKAVGLLIGAAGDRGRWPVMRIGWRIVSGAHAGNADVVRQELEREKSIRLSLRTIERDVAPLRRALEAEARATIRFETPLASSCRSTLASAAW
jgi:hypothetical protein